MKRFSANFLVINEEEQEVGGGGEDEVAPAHGPPASANSTLVNQSLLRKLPIDSESAVLLVGHVKELSAPISQFVRLRTARLLHPELPELPIPLRFVFVLLSPFDHYPSETNILGRTMGSLMVDEVRYYYAFYIHEGIARIMQQVDTQHSTHVSMGK